MDLTEKLRAYVEMRDVLSTAPRTKWKLATDAHIDRELCAITLPAIYVGTLKYGDEYEIRTKSGMPLGTLLKPNVESLRALAKPAPFGRGTERVLDTKVRDAHEIDASTFDIVKNLTAASWLPSIEEFILRECALRGFPRCHFRVVLYKLHIYENGGHFGEHKDTPHGPNHFLSGILILGSPFEGGELVLTADSTSITAEKDPGLRVAAWYTDIPHSVKPVTSGTRVVLQFDVYAHWDKDSETSGNEEEEEKEEEEEYYDPGTVMSELGYNVWSDGLVRHGVTDEITGNPLKQRGQGLPKALHPFIDNWQPVAFLLRHQYLQSGLNFAHLKGVDRALVLALKADNTLCLALEHVVYSRRIPGGDGVLGEPEYEPEWGPMRVAPHEWSIAADIPLFIGPYVMHERSTELEDRRGAEHTGNEPMDGQERYLFAALVVRILHTDEIVSDSDEIIVDARGVKRAIPNTEAGSNKKKARKD